jgi:hypothetical protein
MDSGGELYTYNSSSTLDTKVATSGDIAVYTDQDNLRGVQRATEAVTPSLSVGGDNLTYPTLLPDERATRTATDVQPGATSATLSLSDGAATIQRQWTNTTATADPNVSVSTPAGKQWINETLTLSDGAESEQIPLNASRIDGDISLSVAQLAPSATTPSGTADLYINWTRQRGSHNPAVTVGTNTTQIDDTLFANETATINESFAAGSQQIGLHTVGPTPTPEINVTYRPRNGSTNPTANVGADESVDAQPTSLLGPNETATANVTLSNGSKHIEWGTDRAPVHFNVTYPPQYHTEDVTVDVDDNGTTDAMVDEVVDPNESTTVALPSLTADTTEINVSSPHAPVGYNLTYEFTTGAYNITVTDQDGSTVAKRTEPLLSGEKVTRNIPISGDRRFNVTADGEASEINTTVLYRARNATDSVTIESTGDNDSEVETTAIEPGATSSYTIPVEGSNVTVESTGPAGYEFNYSAVSSPEDVTLSAGNASRTLDGAITSNRTVTLRNVDVGTDQLGIEARRAGFDLTAEWIERNGTIDPTVTYVPTGETLVSADGWLQGTRTVAINDSMFTTMSPTLAFETEAGNVAYEMNMTGHAVATNATATINGIPTASPGSFATNGTLPTDLTGAPTREISSLSGRNSIIALEGAPVDGVDTQITAKVSYFNESAS